MKFCSVNIAAGMTSLRTTIPVGTSALHVTCWHSGSLKKLVQFGGKIITLDSFSANPNLASGYEKIITPSAPTFDIRIYDMAGNPFPDLEYEEEADVDLPDKNLAVWKIIVNATNTVYITVVIENNTGEGVLA